MESTVNEKTSEPVIEYPCLMHSRTSKMIWLMTESEEGTRLTGKDGLEIGEHKKGLVMEYLEPFHGSVTLEN